MPQSVLPSPSQFGTSVTGVPPLDSGTMDLDLDLDLDGTPSGITPAHMEATQPLTSTSRPGFEPAPAPSVPPPAPSAPALTEPTFEPSSLDFSVPQVPDLQTKAPPPVMEPSGFDLSDISLDLDMPPAPAPAPVAESKTGGPSGFGELNLSEPGDLHGEDDPISRKLDLAEEFRQIGDTDGARDLLNEVVAKSTGAVKSRAQSMLADLG
jgi:pilus assembly protein FimV